MELLVETFICGGVAIAIAQDWVEWSRGYHDVARSFVEIFDALCVSFGCNYIGLVQN